MKLRLKKQGAFGVKRISVDAKIDKIEKKNNPVTPDSKRTVVYFKGPEGMGIVDFSPKEVEMLKSGAVKKISEKKGKVKKKR